MFIQKKPLVLGLFVVLMSFFMGQSANQVDAYYVALKKNEVAISLSAKSYVVDEINQARLMAGVPALVVNDKLNLAAQQKANHMVSQGYFSHYTPDQQPFWHFIENVNYEYLFAGENLAVHYNSVENLVDGWLASESHKLNIINPLFSETGIGVAYGEKNGHWGWFVVQLFGTELKYSVSVKDVSKVVPAR